MAGKTNKKLNEEAAGGTTSAASIAVNPARFGGKKKLFSFKGFLMDLNKEIKANSKKWNVVKEAFDLGSLVSKFKGLEMQNKQISDTITYGIEDSSGNLMKVTVNKADAEKFEVRIADELSDLNDTVMYARDEKADSMAELLYNLKDEFNIVDVEFPKIPSDMVYNAADATNDVETPTSNDNSMGNSDMNDPAMSDDMGGDVDDGSIPSDSSMEGGEEDVDDADLMDDESVEDFPEESSTPETLLKAVLDMLKTEAEARTAEANAAAEESRAKQAEYSATAAKATAQDQEQMLRLEAEVDATKKKEKESKRVENLAKYKIQKTMGLANESFSPIFKSILKESDDTESEQNIRAQMGQLSKQYSLTADDSPVMRMYKRKMYQLKKKELQTKIEQIRLRNTTFPKNNNTNNTAEAQPDSADSL